MKQWFGTGLGVVVATCSVFSLAAGAAPLTRAAQPTGPTALHPPALTVLHRSARDAPGYVFVAPKGISGQRGPEIADDRGRPVWFHPTPHDATDFRVQTYGGEPVLTWWQGTGFGGVSQGVDYIADSSYHVIATVRAGNGLDADGHEFLLTPQGTALVTSYHLVPYDLSSVGGPADGQAIDGVVQEIDVATGRVVFEWHSLGHVPLQESYSPVASPYDYFHINSVSLDNDGNLLISGRHAWTIYKVNRQSGQILWRLGGKNSDFTLGPGVQFAWQHDARAAGNDTIRIFDNETSDDGQVMPPSRVIWIKLDTAARTATLAKSIAHGLLARSQGSAQALDNGDTFVGWGQAGHVSEFDPQGSLLFDAVLPGSYDSYRGYRFQWTGRPSTLPTATARRSARRTTTVHAIWNGATEVARWRIMAGRTAARLRRVRTVVWNGLDTSTKIPGKPKRVRVVALDARGRVIAKSKLVRVR